MKFSTSPVLKLRVPVWRSRFTMLIILAGFVVLVARAMYLQGYRNDFLQAKGDSRYSRVIEITANRGKIVDRNGEPLAVSTPVKSVWAIPGEVDMSSVQRKKLLQLLNITDVELTKHLSNKERDFVYLKRQLPPEIADQVEALHIVGISQQREYRRYYPAGEVMAHVLGFTGVEDAGQEGMELAFDSQLVGKAGSRRVLKDRRGFIVEDVQSIRVPQEGKDLTLSVDSKIQYLAFTQLKAAVDENKAKAGAAVVIDARSGEILALVNLPTYNPNNRGKLTGAQLRNRALTDTFEPGSTLKPFTVALAIETGKVKPGTIIQTSPGKLTIGKATIGDAHPHCALTVEEVIQKSSNVGTAKIALTMPAEQMWHNFDNAGFGTSSKLGFPGEAGGRLRPFKSWRPIEQATMSYGHGISVSLLQLARAYTIFARDGELMPLSLKKLDAPLNGKQVISSDTARAVRKMLEMAVQPGGTAPKAQIMGYRVAGKTGTAYKQEGRGYSDNKYIASFVGFAPASNPRLIVAVMVDEPSAGKHFGGDVAAPVFANVMAGVLRILGVPNDAPMKPIEFPPEGSEVKESL